MKKRLNVDSVTNELEQGSVFFQRRPQAPLEPDDSVVEAPDHEPSSQITAILRQTVKPENRKTRNPEIPKAAAGPPTVSGSRRKPAASQPALDLSDDVSQKDTVWLSPEEADALDELKKEFRRKY